MNLVGLEVASNVSRPWTHELRFNYSRMFPRFIIFVRCFVEVCPCRWSVWPSTLEVVRSALGSYMYSYVLLVVLADTFVSVCIAIVVSVSVRYLKTGVPCMG